MKYCAKCGTENPESGLFCMSCGERFPKEAAGDSSQTLPSPSPSYGEKNQRIVKSIAPGVQHVQEVQPVREKFGNLIFSSNYNSLTIGALVFGLTPLLSIGITLILDISVQNSDDLSILTTIFVSICFGVFIYGIYAISQESLPMNEQLSSVPIYLVIYVLGTFFTSLIFDNFIITETMSLDEIRNVVQQGIGIIIINMLISVFLVLGAIKFSNWFEDFVTMLGAPYNGPTNRFMWFSIFTLINWALLALTFFALLSTINNFSYDSLNNVSIFLTIAAFVILATVVLQILSGYKIYSVLNNIRQGKYDGTYQQDIMNRYQS